MTPLTRSLLLLSLIILCIQFCNTLWLCFDSVHFSRCIYVPPFSFLVCCYYDFVCTGSFLSILLNFIRFGFRSVFSLFEILENRLLFFAVRHLFKEISSERTHTNVQRRRVRCFIFLFVLNFKYGYDYFFLTFHFFVLIFYYTVLFVNNIKNQTITIVFIFVNKHFWVSRRIAFLTGVLRDSRSGDTVFC